MNRISSIALALASILFCGAAQAQAPASVADDYLNPKPAFAGQTKAPAPGKLSPSLNIETITTLNRAVVAGIFAGRKFSGLQLQSRGFAECLCHECGRDLCKTPDIWHRQLRSP